MPKKKSGLASSININLKAKPKESIGNVFVKWGVNSGKLIIIVTELIALSALFYRFSVDRKIIDQNDQIKNEQIFIEGQANKEKEYRSIQKRLSQIKIITDETDQKVALMNNIITTLKGSNFQETNISISKNTIRVTGEALSIFAINSFINDLKASPKVDNIGLDEVNSTGEGIEFAVTVELNSLIPEETIEQKALPQETEAPDQ